jgi:C1A family cysteine protease
MVTMRGEWYYRNHDVKEELGGHAINIVGYTDTYMDEHATWEASSCAIVERWPLSAC